MNQKTGYIEIILDLKLIMPVENITSGRMQNIADQCRNRLNEINISADEVIEVQVASARSGIIWSN